MNSSEIRICLFCDKGIKDMDMDKIRDGLIQLAKKIWNLIKKIFCKIVNFVKNIVSFFREPHRLEKLKKNNNIIAASIKENLNNGAYHIVNCLYDTEKEEIVDMQECSLGIEAENIDFETAKHFGDKAMVILT